MRDCCEFCQVKIVFAIVPFVCINPALNWQCDKICLLPFVLINRKFPCYLASRQCWLNRDYHAISGVVCLKIWLFWGRQILNKILNKTKWPIVLRFGKLRLMNQTFCTIGYNLPPFLSFFWCVKYLSSSLKLILLIAIT